MTIKMPGSPQLMRAAVCFIAIATIICATLLWTAVPTVRAASCGAVNVSGSSWAGGFGVDSRSNGAYEGTTTSCGGFVTDLNANPPQYGEGWQCVELAQRMYNTRGWYSGLFAGVSYASQIYTSAAQNGWTTMANGSITLGNIVPGDMLVTNEGTAGHVMLVDSISGNTIKVVDQNAGDGGRDTVTFSNGSLSDGSYSFSGVVHSPKNTLGALNTSSSPVVDVKSDDSTDVFIVGTEGNLYHKWWTTTGGWSSWANRGSPGSNLIGTANVLLKPDDTVDIFAPAANGSLYHIWKIPGSNWSGWAGLGRPSGVNLVGIPAVDVKTDGSNDVFILGSDGNLWYDTWSSATGWSGWNNLSKPTTLTGSVNVIHKPDDTLDVFAVGTNGALYHKWLVPGSAWSGWAGLSNPSGVMLAGRPSLAIKSDGSNDVFLLGSDGNLWHKWWTSSGGWSSWTNQSKPSTSLVGTANLILKPDDTEDVFALGSNGSLYHTWKIPGSPWSGWAGLSNAGGGLTGMPALGIKSDGSNDIFMMSNNGSIYHNWWVPGGTWNGWGSLGSF